MAQKKLTVVAHLGRADPFRNDHDAGWNAAGERYRVRFEDGGEEVWLLDRIKLEEEQRHIDVEWECVKPY